MNINSINMKPVTAAITQKTTSKEVPADSISLGNTSPSGFMDNVNQLKQLSETGKK